MPTVRMLWGLNPEPGDEPTIHTYPTEELMHAFLEGVDAAVGWLDHIQLDEGDNYCFKHRDTYAGEACPHCAEED